jgi:hypothetical protein
VPCMSRISTAHHNLGVKHLLVKLGHSHGSILLRISREQSKTYHEKIRMEEGSEVGSNLSEIAVELIGQSEAADDSRHISRNEMVQIAIGGMVSLRILK